MVKESSTKKMRTRESSWKRRMEIAALATSIRGSQNTRGSKTKRVLESSNTKEREKAPFLRLNGLSGKRDTSCKVKAFIL